MSTYPSTPPSCSQTFIGSITTNKPSGGDGIPAELFQIQQDDTDTVLPSVRQQVELSASWKNLQWPQDLIMSVIIPIPMKGNAKECSYWLVMVLILCVSKVTVKSLQARLQWYVNRKLPDVQAGFRKDRGTRDRVAKIRWIIKKAREFQKSIYFCFIGYMKAFDCVDHNKLWKILKEMAVPDLLTCSLRNLCAGQDATIRTEQGTKDRFQIGKGVCQGCIMSPCYLNYMQSTSCKMPCWMEHKLESRNRRNIHNPRHADDITLRAEIEEELKSLLMKVKEESEKAALKLNIKKTKVPLPHGKYMGKKWKQ